MSFQTVADIEILLTADHVSARDLYAAWDARQNIAWLGQDTSLARRFTNHAIEQNEFLLVWDAAREIVGERHADPADDIDLIRLRMDFATALSRLGLTSEARAVVEPYVSSDRTSPPKEWRAEVLLLLGNIVRDESHHSPAEAQRSAAEALGFYEQALEAAPRRLDALLLATAAALGVREPDWKGAKERAQEILGAAEELENARGKALQTVEARATAYAVLGDVDKAARHFAELAGLEASTTDKLADIRHRAQFLAVAVGKPRDFFKGAFPPLQLIVFSGHAPDRPDQPPDQPGRFPPESIEPIRHTMAVKLDELKARVGLVSACAGGDLLFNEAMQARHGIVHLVLPWSGEEFRRTSVRPFERAGSPLWERLFESALDHAATIRTMGQVYEPSHDVGWEYMMEVTAGIALRTARARRLDIQPLALWDGQPGRGAGGTDAFVALWGEQLKRDVIVMKPPIAPAIHVSHSGLPGAVTERPIPYPVARRQRIQRTERPILQQEVKSLLFADIVGYSKLTEKAILEFVGVFLDRVSRLVASTQHAPFSLNTWGDAVYAVFDHGRDAGLFALELAELVEAGIRDGEWIGKGLYWEEQIDGESAPRKHPLNIRIGLHTGPVLMHYDPVVRMLGVTGTHVSRAARIEPVAMPGQVLASEEFAAMVDLSGEIQKVKGAGSGIGFACEYAGTMKLAKAYPGRHRIFRVVRKQAFALEELAKAAHADYCAEAKKRGETFETNSSLRPWEELPEDLRAANRSLAADIPFKLKELGFELAQTNGISAMEIPESGDRMERSAIREHDRWMGERMRNGWTYAEKRDNARKHHPSLVSWDRLPEVEKEKDREIIRSLRAQIERAGLRVRRLE